MGVNYQLSDYFGIGANYNFVQLDVGVNGDLWRGEIKTTYDGLYVYLSVFW